MERERVEFPPTLISFTFERTIQHHQAQESVVEVICTYTTTMVYWGKNK